MRIALISDIHGNIVALETVLASIENSVDQVVCLGDVAMTGPQPREVLARLQALGWPVVMGNTDAWLLDPQPEHELPQVLQDIENWAASQLGEEDRRFVQTFQPVVEVSLANEQTLLCYHGSPRNFSDNILPTTPDEELAEFLEDAGADVLAGGHTHQQMVRVFDRRLLINPGSVGLPFLREGDEIWNPSWAEYAVLEVGEGILNVELRRVPVAFERLEAMVAASDMPHADLWLAGWH